MKIFLLSAVLFFASNLNAQRLKGLIKKIATDTAISKTNKSNLSTNEIAAGLKEALNIGVQKGTAQLSTADGFFKNAAVKILLPNEALKAEKTLRDMGLGIQVDEAILSMNRAAEDAAKTASSIFITAIKQMSIQDAVGILTGGDSAATTYLKQKTNASLTNAFSPIIKQSLAKVDATKYWNIAFFNYNKIPFVKKINTDLTAYVTEKALSGIFYQVAQEEQKIRQNPLAQTTNLLKKTFGKQ